MAVIIVMERRKEVEWTEFDDREMKKVKITKILI